MVKKAGFGVGGSFGASGVASAGAAVGPEMIRGTGVSGTVDGSAAVGIRVAGWAFGKGVEADFSAGSPQATKNALAAAATSHTGSSRMT